MLLLLFILLVVVVLSGVRIINQQSIAVVERFGRFSRVMHPGLNFIIPVVERVVGTVTLKVTTVNAEVAIKTADNMFVTLPVALMLKVAPDKAQEAFYKLANPDSQIATWVLNALRAATSTMKLAELYEDRDRLAAEVTQALGQRLEGYGYVIEAVLVDQPAVSAEVQASFNRVVASQRDKEAATQQAEAQRIMMVGAARAEAESQELRAEGLAKARSVLVANLGQTVSSAREHGVSEADVMRLLLETNRLDTISHAAQHGKLVVMDLRSEHTVLPTLNLPQD